MLLPIVEHHRKDFAVSKPEILFAAVASRTKKIHLPSAITNLPTINLIRVYKQYATGDAIALGKVEIMAGLRSFTEVFA